LIVEVTVEAVAETVFEAVFEVALEVAAEAVVETTIEVGGYSQVIAEAMQRLLRRNDRRLLKANER